VAGNDVIDLRRFCFCLALLAAGVAPRRAAAQEGPYANYLVGERSLGLAGAFVSVADDPSAIFHNPGGIATLTSSAAAGSLWTLLRGSREIQDGYRTDLGRTDLVQSAPLSLPLFLAGVIKFGPRQRDRVRPHALGAAIMTPYTREDRFVGQLSEDESAVDRIEVRQLDRARWFGVAYGLRLRPGLSFGASGFLALTNLEHDEVEIRGRAGEGTNVGSGYSRSSTLGVSAQHVVVRVGTQLELTHELAAGMMVQLPGFALAQEADAETLLTRVGPDPTSIELDRRDGLPANVAIPIELRMGVTVRKPEETLLTLDVSLFGPVGSESDRRPLVKSDAVPLGAFVPEETYRRAALRGALGFETAVANMFPLRGGVFFERSSAPPVLARSDFYARDHIDTVGAALSLGFRWGGYDLAVGSTAIFGWGEALALRRDEDFGSAPRYEGTDVHMWSVMVYVGGAKSAVKQLVQTLLE
jgi:hypothetical protein